MQRNGGEVTIISMEPKENLNSKLNLAADLAEALTSGECSDIHDYQGPNGKPAPRGAHSWPEVQTVLAAWRAGKPVLPQGGEKKPAKKAVKATKRANMYEPDLAYDDYEENSGDDSDEGLDPHDFNYAEVGITNTARKAFEGDDLEMLILLGCAVRHGGYRPGREGAHKVFYKEHNFILSSGADVVVSYAKYEKARKNQRDTVEVEVKTIDLNETGFDPETIELGRGMIYSFINKHGVDEDEAEEEIRSFLAWANEENKHRVLKNGCHLFDHQGFKVWVSPDGKLATKYETLHIERTPLDVKEGVPSRFGKKRA